MLVSIIKTDEIDTYFDQVWWSKNAVMMGFLKPKDEKHNKNETKNHQTTSLKVRRPPHLYVCAALSTAGASSVLPRAQTHALCLKENHWEGRRPCFKMMGYLVKIPEKMWQKE